MLISVKRIVTTNIDLLFLTKIIFIPIVNNRMFMIIHINNPSAVRTRNIFDKMIHIIVDTFRATTSLLTLKYAGAKRIYVVQNEDDARSIQNELSEECLLIGEKGGLKITGFDYGNTPSEFFNLDFSDMEIIFTSTSGAKAIRIPPPNEQVYVGALVNLAKIAVEISEIAVKEQKDISIIPAGYYSDETTYILEDWVTSVLIADEISKRQKSTIESKSVFLEKTQKILAQSANIKKLLKNAPNALELKKLGFMEDVNFAIKINLLDNILKVNKWLKINNTDCVVLE